MAFVITKMIIIYPVIYYKCILLIEFFIISAFEVRIYLLFFEPLDVGSLNLEGIS